VSEREGWFQTNEGTWLPNFMHYDPAVPHLGGYLKGGDSGSYNPDLWAWLLRYRKVRSVIDVGCGEGHAIQWFRDHGCRVLGVEGIEQPDPDIVQHDYTQGPWRTRRKFDLCWSCEFVEHVAPEYEKNFLATFKAAPLLLMTHATGSGGHHHVNYQQPGYWIERVEALGFELDRRLTKRTRELANPHGYYRQTGLAFMRG
jgi:SAM-dependent methyltransferase